MTDVIPRDKMSAVQVLGSLLKKPSLLLEEKYVFSLEDFPEKFHQVLYGAIENLVKSGVQSFTFVTIDDFLSKYERQYKIFTVNRGNDWIQYAMTIADIENFDYYYNNLKKFSLLSALSHRGFDTKRIYDSTEVNPTKIEKIQEKFDDMTIDEIVENYEKDINELKEMFNAGNTDGYGVQSGVGLKKLKEELKIAPEFGMNLASKKLTTICRGARIKKLYMRSSPSGYFKTRSAVGDALTISVPWIFNLETNEWEYTSCNEPTLFITTELEISEIQTMVIAFVSGVGEEKILDGKYTKEEEERVDKAIGIIEKSNFYIEYMPSFNIETLEQIIKKHKYIHEIGYVFFDYLFASVKILTEMSRKANGVKMREDNILLLAIDKLKFLANTLNVFIFTATQVNDTYKTVQSADQGILRGAKSLADKVDIGFATLPISAKDKEAITPIVHMLHCKEPNCCIHVYKARRSKLSKVKLWIFFDASTMRSIDCFVTNNDYELLNVDDTNIEVILEENKEEMTEAFEEMEETEEPVKEEASASDWY
jgi:replicative DNA helicase